MMPNMEMKMPKNQSNIFKHTWKYLRWMDGNYFIERFFARMQDFDWSGYAKQISNVLKTILRFGYCFLCGRTYSKCWLWIDYIPIAHPRINLNICANGGRRVHSILVNVENVYLPMQFVLIMASIHMNVEMRQMNEAHTKKKTHPPLT